MNERKKGIGIAMGGEREQRIIRMRSNLVNSDHELIITLVVWVVGFKNE